MESPDARAYVLIAAELGRGREVLAAVRQLPGVTRADIVAGPYDVVAVVEAPHAVDVGHIVLDRLQRVPGVKTTLTLIVTS